jgi:hypothetical protein
MCGRHRFCFAAAAPNALPASSSPLSNSRKATSNSLLKISSHGLSSAGRARPSQTASSSPSPSSSCSCSSSSSYCQRLVSMPHFVSPHVACFENNSFEALHGLARQLLLTSARSTCFSPPHGGRAHTRDGSRRRSSASSPPCVFPPCADKVIRPCPNIRVGSKRFYRRVWRAIMRCSFGSSSGPGVGHCWRRHRIGCARVSPAVIIEF